MGTRAALTIAVLLTMTVLAAGCAASAPSGPVGSSPASGTPTSSGGPSAMPTTPGSGSSPSGGELSLPPTKPAPAPGILTLHGTVRAGVESGCLLLTDHSVDYLLVGGDPAVIKVGATVTVTGQVDLDIRSYCMQGKPFQVRSATAG